MSQSTDSGFNTAVVIGASIAGVTAAASLAPHFDEVIVLDRDELPEEIAKRPGVPHSYQFHTLNGGGRVVLESIFPGLIEDLEEGGAPTPDLVNDMRYRSKFGWFPRVVSGHDLLPVTRRYVEWYIRRRAQSLANVEIRPRTRARGLVIEEGQTRGVKIRDLATGEDSVVAADFVVDASGRKSQVPNWLATAGYEKPVESVVNARWGYATTYVEAPEDYDPGWLSTLIAPTISGEGLGATRGAAMWRQEGNRYVVTAQGCAGDYPPGDLEGFKDFVSSFGYTYFRDLIDEFGTSEPVEIWRDTANVRRNYADLADRPERFVVIGDAASAFNPVYGQGIPASALASERLGNAVADRKASGEGLDGGFGAAYQKDLHEFISPFWEFSTGSDYGVPGVEVDGKPYEAEERPETAYADRVLALATEDPEITIKFMETVSMLRDTSWMAEESLRTRIVADWDRLGTITPKAEPNPRQETVLDGSVVK